MIKKLKKIVKSINGDIIKPAVITMLGFSPLVPVLAENVAEDYKANLVNNENYNNGNGFDVTDTANFYNAGIGLGKTYSFPDNMTVLKSKNQSMNNGKAFTVFFNNTTPNATDSSIIEGMDGSIWVYKDTNSVIKQDEIGSNSWEGTGHITGEKNPLGFTEPDTSFSIKQVIDSLYDKNNVKYTITSDEAINKLWINEGSSNLHTDSVPGTIKTATLENLANGSHTHQIIGMDGSGNYDTVSNTIIIDYIEPDTSFNFSNVTSTSNKDTIKVATTSNEPNQVSVKHEGSEIFNDPAFTKNKNFAKAGFANGTYIFEVTGKDTLGYTQTVSDTVVVDYTAPDTSFEFTKFEATNASAGTVNAAVRAGEPFKVSVDYGSGVFTDDAFSNVKEFTATGLTQGDTAVFTAIGEDEAGNADTLTHKHYIPYVTGINPNDLAKKVQKFMPDYKRFNLKGQLVGEKAINEFDRVKNDLNIADGFYLDKNKYGIKKKAITRGKTK